MINKIIEIICEYSGVDKEKVNLESKLIKDVGLSSFDVTELVCKFEEEFDIEIPDRKISTFQTVSDIVEFVNNQKGTDEDE